MPEPAPPDSEAHEAEEVRGPRAVGEQELHGEEVEQHAQRAAEAVLAAPARARPVVDLHLGHGDAHPGGDRGDEAVHLAVEPQALHDLGADRLQRAAVVVQVHAGGPRDEPVREPRGQPLATSGSCRCRRQPQTMSKPSSSFATSARDVGGVVLQVAVRGHDDVAARVVEPGGEGRRLAEVAAQRAAPARAGRAASIAASALARAVASSRRRPAGSRTAGPSARAPP